MLELELDAFLAIQILVSGSRTSAISLGTTCCTLDLAKAKSYMFLCSC
jgi:hypothetical protein